jgi:hypothetical protein
MAGLGPGYTVINDTRLQRKLGTVVKATNDEMYAALDELAKIGRDEMRHIVETSGTNFSRFRASKGVGSTGRIRSGKMYDSIGLRHERGPKVMRVTIGFIRGTIEKYFKLQDQGFTNVWRFFSFGKGTSGPNAPQGFKFVHWRTLKKRNPEDENAHPVKTQGMFALRNAKEAIAASEGKVLSKMKAKITRRVNAGK